MSFFTGKISLDDVFKERDTLNHSIVGKIFDKIKKILYDMMISDFNKLYKIVILQFYIML